MIPYLHAATWLGTIRKAGKRREKPDPALKLIMALFSSHGCQIVENSPGDETLDSSLTCECWSNGLA